MEKQLAIAIVGVGNRGKHCFSQLIKERTDCRIAALCDVNRYRAELVAREFGDPPVYTDIKEMLNKENLDGVIITTPDAFHEECAVTALKHKVNVLIDKPLATSVAGCRNIVKAVEDSGKTAMIGFNLRHAPILVKLKQIIDEGVIGRVILIENSEYYSGGRTYMARWNGRKSFSGGLWIHKGCHDFDVFNWLLNFPMPRKVTAFAGMSVFTPENYPFEIEDNIKPGPSCRECHYCKNNKCPDAVVHDADEWGKEAQAFDGYVKDSCMYQSDMSVHDNGVAIVEYENGVRATHTECFVTGKDYRTYNVVGTKGAVFCELHGTTLTVTKRYNKETITYEITPPKGGHAGADPGLLDSFLRAIRGEKVKCATFEEGLLSTAIGQAAELSKDEERVVFLKELLG